ncbi:Ubiquinone biosynthesis O-methyltransferase [uncultured archaeon]|nr:Ubiquinone biosynthesis O-methyltransferase [uncultured archaeon]
MKAFAGDALKKDVVSETIETYEATAADFYKREEHFDIPEIIVFADFFIKKLKGKKILDIGCGPGRDSKYFSGNGLDVTGIDAASSFIKIASKNVPAAKFIKMDMRKLDFPGNSFDGIWACASFLHIPKSEARNTLIGISCVLKPRGILYISVKEGSEEKVLKKEEYLGRAKFFAFYTQKEFEDLIVSCGFEIIETRIDKKADTWINVFAIKK